MVPRFPLVAVSAPAAEIEALCDLLFELGAQGIEQRDAETHPEQLPWTDEASRGNAAVPICSSEVAQVEDGQGRLRTLESRRAAAADPGPDAPTLLLASFGSRAEAEAALTALQTLRPSVASELGEVVGDEWRDRYRARLAPFLLTPNLLILPPWVERTEVEEQAELCLVLDPGRAFGTGLHPTTALVAHQLAERRAALAGQTLLDVGTGSGILALTALRLGARQAVGLDTDETAVAVARENAARNGLGALVHFATTPVAELVETYPWVVANIELPVLLPLAPALAARVAPGGALVLSGLLASHITETLDRYRAIDGGAHFELEQTEQRASGDDVWVAMTLRRVAA